MKLMTQTELISGKTTVRIPFQMLVTTAGDGEAALVPCSTAPQCDDCRLCQSSIGAPYSSTVRRQLVMSKQCWCPILRPRAMMAGNVEAALVPSSTTPPYDDGW